MSKKFLFLLSCLITGTCLYAQPQKFIVIDEAILGAQKSGQVTHISHNGKYIVGSSDNLESLYSSFIWDMESVGYAEWVTDEAAGLGKEGIFTAISNNKVAAGYHRSNEVTITGDDGSAYPTTMAAIWKDGMRVSLGSGNLSPEQHKSSGDGSYATSISSDGNIVGGYLLFNQQTNYLPIVWSYNETTDSWEYEIYTLPIDAKGGIINSISGDGSIAVGYASYQSRTLPVCWTSKEEVFIVQRLEAGETPKTGLDFPEYTNGSCYWISEDGEYISLLSDIDSPAYYYFGKKYGDVNGHFYTMDVPKYTVNTFAGAISNKGVPFFTYTVRDPLQGEYSQTFFRHSDYYDFSSYIKFFASEVTIPDNISFYSEDGQTTRIIGSSNDGNILLGVTEGLSWVLYAPYDSDVYIPNKPFKGLTASLTDYKEVTIQFEGGYGKNLLYEPAGFNLYRNGKFVAFISEEQERDNELYTFIDNEESNITTGYNNYSISLVMKPAEGEGPGIGWGWKAGITTTSTKMEEDWIESERSDIVTVVVSPTFELPFFDDLESVSLETNYWTPVSETGGLERYSWSIGKYLGVYASYGIYMGLDIDSYYDESLVSRHMDATNLEKVYISYMINHGFFITNPSDFVKDQDFLSVEVLPQGSDKWIVVKSHSPATDTSNKWQNQLIDISQHVKNKVFQIRFHSTGSSEARVIWYLDHIKVGGEDADKEAPEAIMGDAGNGGVNLYWRNSMNAFELTNAAGELNEVSSLRVIGNENKRFIAANLFEKEDLKHFDGMYLTSVNFDIEEKVEGLKTNFNIVIYEDNELVVKQAVDSYTPNNYNTFYLTEENIRIIDMNKSLKVGIELGQHDPNETPIVYQNTLKAIPGKTDLYASAETNWEWASLKDFYEEEAKSYPTDQQNGIKNLGYCIWNISANITPEREVDSSRERDNMLYIYDVLRDGIRINELPVSYTTPKFVDENPSGELSCYTVRAYYLDGGISGLSPEFCFDTTSIEENNVVNSSIHFYPNPACEKVYVTSLVNNLSLLNLNGQLLKETHENQMDISNIPEGIYLIKIEAIDGLVITDKLFISK